jgi:hypothetical protein
MRTKYNWTTAILLANAVAVAPLVMTCATEPPRRPVALDPSNPGAPESPPLLVASDSRPAAAPNAPAPDPSAAPPSPVPGEGHAHDHGADDEGKAGNQEATVYTCPMHPEVISDKPGRCPKCGMQLAPKKPAPSEGQK